MHLMGYASKMFAFTVLTMLLGSMAISHAGSISSSTHPNPSSYYTENAVDLSWEALDAADYYVYALKKGNAYYDAAGEGAPWSADSSSGTVTTSDEMWGSCDLIFGETHVPGWRAVFSCLSGAL